MNEKFEFECGRPIQRVVPTSLCQVLGYFHTILCPIDQRPANLVGSVTVRCVTAEFQFCRRNCFSLLNRLKITENRKAGEAADQFYGNDPWKCFMEVIFGSAPWKCYMEVLHESAQCKSLDGNL